MSDDRLHHLLDRMRRGVLLPAEREQLAGLVGELEARAERAERLAQTRAARIDAITTDRSSLRQQLASQETETMRQHARVTELTAGQCTHALAMCLQHHTVPVDGCPYPRCMKARKQQEADHA